MKNGTMHTLASAVLALVACAALAGCADGEALALRESVSRQLGKGSRAGETKTLALPGGASMEMVWCPPGTFTMGSPKGEGGRQTWFEPSKAESFLMAFGELPEHGDFENLHPVTLTKGFWMARTEVTQAQWESVMGNNPSLHAGDGNLPVEQVSIRAVGKFCKKTGLQLPTEAEWEYACRAGTSGPYAGRGNLDAMGWYEGNSGDRTHPVGQKAPNAWGLLDMHGNVEEWCEDVYDWDLGRAAVTNPLGKSTGGRRSYDLTRGGSYEAEARDCRSAHREKTLLTTSYWTIGFRPVARGE